jgi:hypothetical protein
MKLIILKFKQKIILLQRKSSSLDLYPSHISYSIFRNFPLNIPIKVQFFGG